MRRTADLRRAATMACRVLADRRISELPVDPLRLLRACRDTRVYTADEAAEILEQPAAAVERMFDVSEAVTFAEHTDGGTRYIVIYKPCGNPARLRFTLAHELGHRVLGHQARELADEREADCFASHLLCPQPVMDYLCREGGKPTAAQLAGLFYVSIPCARAVLRRQRILLENELKEAMQELCGRLVISPVKHPEENAPPKDE